MPIALAASPDRNESRAAYRFVIASLYAKNRCPLFRATLSFSDRDIPITLLRVDRIAAEYNFAGPFYRSAQFAFPIYRHAPPHFRGYGQTDRG